MKVDFSDLDVSLRARSYTTMAEKHAFSMGYIDAAYGMEKGEHDTAKNWPNAYSAGYWEAKKTSSDIRRVEWSSAGPKGVLP